MVFDKDAGSSTHSLPLSDEGSSDALLLPPHPSPPRLSSQTKTFANVFISIVGSGVLGLPYAFRRTGWAAGLLSLAVVAVLTTHCMMLLVHTRRRVDAKGRIASFGDLGLAVAGRGGRAAVDSMIFLTQAGFCVGYTIFIGNTLAHLFPFSPRILSPKPLFVFATLPFQLALNSIRSLTRLAPLSIFADVVDIGAMGVVAGEDLSIFLRNKPDLKAFGGPSVVLYGLGVAVYAFEGVGMVLPLEAEAKDKARFGTTLSLSMAFISFMYGAFGALGYMAFGEDTKDIITTNFGRGPVTVLVQLGLCINLFFTFPIMMNPVYEVVERSLFGNRYCRWARWVLVVAVSLAALLVPNFADFLSLVGSSVCCILGFVLPALFHLKVFGGEMGWGAIASDVTITVVGIVFAVSGTWSSIIDIFFSTRV